MARSPAAFAVVTMLVLLGRPAFAAPNNYSNGEHVTCEGVIKRDLVFGTWLDSTRMCSQTFLQDLVRVFLPSGVAPISTSMHSAVSSIRACR